MNPTHLMSSKSYASLIPILVVMLECEQNQEMLNIDFQIIPKSYYLVFRMKRHSLCNFYVVIRRTTL